MEYWKKIGLIVFFALNGICWGFPCRALSAMRMQVVMGTLLQIEVIAKNSEMAEKAVESAFTEVKRLDDLLSNYKENSEVSRINREAYPESVVTDEETFSFLSRALEWSELTDGHFDLTMEPLTRLWKLRERNIAEVPSKKESGDVRMLVNYKALELHSSGRSVRFLLEGMGIDTGGMGKGYALDKAMVKIRQFPIESATLNFGGEILYWSKKPLQRMVGVKNPLNPEKIWKTIFIKTGFSTATAVSTSANYERFVSVENRSGEKIGHILDLKTGRPASHSVRSVTVVSKNATDADVLSTAVFAMGFNRGKKFAESMKGSLFLILYENEDGSLGRYLSKEWRKIIN